MYHYIKALHIIFIVTWFSGMFYIVRLFIYNAEAGGAESAARDVLRKQYSLMIRRLWLGITWPSAILTLVFGTWMFFLYPGVPRWLVVKLILVGALYLYHYSLHIIYRQQRRSLFRFTSQQLRIWNEVATLFLVSIVLVVVLKDSLRWVWGLLGLAALTFVLMMAIRIYKKRRMKAGGDL